MKEKERRGRLGEGVRGRMVRETVKRRIESGNWKGRLGEQEMGRVQIPRFYRVAVTVL